MSDFQSLVQSLQGAADVDLLRVDPATGSVVVNFRVDMARALEALMVVDHRLGPDLESVASSIMWWGVVAARAKRAWDVREREFRVWKAAREVEFRSSTVEESDDADGPKKGKKSKPPSAATIESWYRTTPGYDAVAGRSEAAQEAYLIAEAIYQGYRAKKDVLLKDLFRAPDGKLARISP